MDLMVAGNKSKKQIDEYKHYLPVRRELRVLPIPAKSEGCKSLENLARYESLARLSIQQ